MNPKTKSVCFTTLFLIMSAVVTISIGYTNFVQAEIKEDIVDIKNNQLLNNEKISSSQVNQAETRGDIKLILQLLNQQSKDEP